MRPSVLCVIFAIVARGGSGDNDFRPTPIPLGEWDYDRRESRAVSGDVRPVAIPAHYWEDALRHSVYLTLVRDKIDQLIAKGDVISPDSKPDLHTSKDIDDHDLWEKIKTAPFDRIQEEEPLFGDVTIMAKGRLVEDRGRFRFTEDQRSSEKCNIDSCMEGVKALWSVKRVRQRDSETSPGKYNYELTFSVSSHQPKKQKKPYENPVRTFTVKETTPDQVLDMPQEHRSIERSPIMPMPSHAFRHGRGVWIHKNIVPVSQSRQHQSSGLDRLFSSLFSDEDDSYEPPRYRPNPYIPPPPPYQYSKVGYVGSPTDQQKRLTPYPYKPHSYKYSRPVPPPPPFTHMQHHYVESDSIGHPYATPPDHRYGPPTKPMKTTRPAVLPTPLPPVTAPKNWTVESDIAKPNDTDISTKGPEKMTPYRTYNKPRPMQMKINYLPDHVRPPIYNAPPGVFVTMDKKPFKPMPPLKLVSKPIKHHKPVDFRPSPQVLDMQQFSEPDPQHDTAFRPIYPGSWSSSENSTTTTEKIEVAETTTQINNTRKVRPKGKKPPKKHEIIKVTRTTTSAPEIITASSDSGEESDAMQWANVIGAISRTTPMASQKEKSETPESTTSSTTTSTTTPSTTTAFRRKTTTTTESYEDTTTARPKRTRPPPKFVKQEKFKKHKRITTTTTKAPQVTKASQDLTPQASSLTGAKPKPTWSPEYKVSTTTTSTTSTTTTTTKRPPTTTQTVTETTQTPKKSETKSTSSTTQPKIKNRYRQSTLMTKGTSLNHDKWSTPVESGEKGKPTVPTDPAKMPPRRKGSNFQGYVSSTTPRTIDKYEKYHEDQGPPKSLTVQPLSTTTSTYDETADQYENNGESSDYVNKFDTYPESGPSGDDEQESRDHTEYIFQTSTPSDRTNEVDDEPITTEQIITSPVSVPKNKTKCKKKKPQDTIIEKVGELALTESSSPITTTPPTTPTEVSTPSIFEELFGSFTVDDSPTQAFSTSKPDLQEQESEKHGHFVKLDDDLKDFLDSLEAKSADGEEEYSEEDDDDAAIDEEESPFNNDEERPSGRDANAFEDYQERPFSILELMAMD